MHQPAFVELNLVFAELRFEQFGIADHRRHPADDRLIRAEKIIQRDGDHEAESREKAKAKPEDGSRGQKFPANAELQDLDEIEDEKDQWQDGVVDTIFQKGFAGSGQKAEMAAKDDKGRDVPAHDKDPGSQSDDGSADGADVSEIFRREKECVRTIGPHESAVQGAEEDQPEDQQYLELFYVQ
jgi:hypothetical protein